MVVIQGTSFSSLILSDGQYYFENDTVSASGSTLTTTTTCPASDSGTDSPTFTTSSTTLRLTTDPSVEPTNVSVYTKQ